MRNVRETHGTPQHRKAARYHMSKCHHGKDALHAQLQQEMGVLYKNLVNAARATEDAEDDLVDASAMSDATEIDLENVIRDIDGDLAKLDRENPSLNARATVFPNGFGQEIDPEGDQQIPVLIKVKERLAGFSSYPVITDGLARLNSAEAAFRTALNTEDQASAKVDACFAAEQTARRAIREQLTSAYGRLRDLYKSRPVLAEQFFLREPGSRHTKKAS